MSVITETFLFKPPSLGSCYVWLDASTSNNFTFSSGTNIATWIDRSGNGYTATAVNNPTYDSTNKRVRFASASTQAFSNTSAPLNLAQRSFFFVLEEITNANVCGIMPIIPSPTTGTDYTTTNGMTIEGTSGVYFYANAGGYANRVTATVPLAKGLYSEVFSNPTGTPYLNGTAGTNATANFTPGTSAGYGLGGRWANGLSTPYFNGYFYEVLVYSKALSTTERQQIEGYLAWKWGLQGSLPAAHPYKLTPLYSAPPFPLVRRVPTASGIIGFNPRGLSGCQLWFDASDPTTYSLSNGLVTQWNDKSSNSYRVLQTNASFQPALTLNALNGFPGIQTTTTAFLSNATSNMTNFTTGAATSAFYVARNASANTGWNIFNTIWFTGTLSGTQRYHFSFNHGGVGTGVTLFVSPTLKVGQSTTVTPGANAILGFTVGSSSTTINVDGGVASYAGNTLNDVNDATQFIFGDARANSAANSNVMMFEMVGYNRQLSTSEVQLVEGYFAWKWGLTANLPSTHPFKTVRVAALPLPNPTLVATSQFFNPRRIADCALWIDAFDTSTITTTGTQVTAVTDKSGTGKALTVYNTISYTPKQALIFTNNTGNLNVASMPPAPYDILTVATGNPTTTAYRTLLRTAGGPGTHPFLLEVNTNNLGMWDSTAFRQFGSLTMAANEKALVYATMATDRTMQAAKNGTISLTVSTPAGNESVIVTIGNIQSGIGGQPWGNLHELLIFSRTLSTVERQQIEGYLAWKWGLNSRLPASHPFAKFPPSP